MITLQSAFLAMLQCSVLGASQPPVLNAMLAMHRDFASIEFVYEGEYGALDDNGEWKAKRDLYSGKGRYLKTGKVYYEVFQQDRSGGVLTKATSFSPAGEMRRKSTPSKGRPDQFRDSPNAGNAFSDYCFGRYWILPALVQQSQACLDKAVHEGRETVDGMSCEVFRFPDLQSKGWFCPEKGGNIVRWDQFNAQDGKLLTRLHKVKTFEVQDHGGRQYWLVGKAVKDHYFTISKDRKGIIAGLDKPQFRWAYNVAMSTVKLNYGPDSKDLEVQLSSRYSIETPKTYAAMRPPPKGEIPIGEFPSNEEVKRAVDDAKAQEADYTAKPASDYTMLQSWGIVIVGLSGLVAAYFLMRRARQ